MKVEITSLESSIFSDTADSVVVTSENGELGIYPHHISLIAKLQPGSLRIIKNNIETVFAVSGGYVEVYNNVVTVLADMIENAYQYNESEITLLKQSKEESLKNTHTDDIGYAILLSEIAKIHAQLKTLKRIKTR